MYFSGSTFPTYGQSIASTKDLPIRNQNRMIPLQGDSNNISAPQYLVEPVDLARLGSEVLL